MTTEEINERLLKIEAISPAMKKLTLHALILIIALLGFGCVLTGCASLGDMVDLIQYMRTRP